MRTQTIACLALAAAVAVGLTGCHAKVQLPQRKSSSKQKEKERAPDPPLASTEEAPAGDEVVFGPPVIREQIAAGRAASRVPVIKLADITSNHPHASKADALTDALAVARIELMKHLEQLDPPVHAKPSLVTMRTEYLKGEVRVKVPTAEQKEKIKQGGVNPNVSWAVIDLELTDDQVQRLRSSERVSDAFRGGALLFAFLAAIYGFLRLDQWSKGHLTMWLGLAAGLIVGGVALVVLA